MFYLIYVLLHTHYWAQKALGNSLLAGATQFVVLRAQIQLLMRQQIVKTSMEFPQLFKIGEGLWSYVQY